MTLAALPIVVIGAGPAGLMAAEQLQQAGLPVQVMDAMPSAGRKFLLAGKGGLNLTHSEAADIFVTRYGAHHTHLAPLLDEFASADLRDWASSLGVETFVGSSGRVFPRDMKAAPLLRAWLQRLRHPDPARALPPVEFHMRHRWTGWATHDPNPLQALCFDTPQGSQVVHARAVVLALGGGSWGRLGSNGAWVPLLQQQGVAVAPLLPANCGFDMQTSWSEFFASRFAGQPFKTVAITVPAQDGQGFSRKGEFVATATGIEGSLIYAASSLLRSQLLQTGQATVFLDLLPDMPLAHVLAHVQHPRGARSLSSHLKSRLHLDGIKTALLHELLPKDAFADLVRLAQAIKALPLTLGALRPLDEAISSAGGVAWQGLTQDLMLTQHAGVFCAGEMLDWEAPTGGYLLQACFATGFRAGRGAAKWVGTEGGAG
jgi:uncharacterized flavoprotein (TIGR03862 family)